MQSVGHVFAYGSLAASSETPRRQVVELRNHMRDWSVAMDNRETVPGYKRYTLDGLRHGCHVAFLTVVREVGSAVNGVASPVSAAQLDTLDVRERNYDRIDVTDLVSPVLPGRVWTYVASAAGRARFERAVADGDGAVPRAYLDAVDRAFAELGEDQLARYRASTRPPPFPVLPLERRDLPA